MTLLFIIAGFFIGSKILAADTSQGTVNLSTNTLEYINLSIISGDSINFGNITPGNPIQSTGTIASVSTNSANGYMMSISDNIAGNDSALTHSDGVTHIADYAGTIAAPTLWTGTGLGITMFAADHSKEAKWGTGTIATDIFNRYAGIPQSFTMAHTVAEYIADPDTSSWAFEFDVPNTQKTGSYSGNVIFTATAVLS